MTTPTNANRSAARTLVTVYGDYPIYSFGEPKRFEVYSSTTVNGRVVAITERLADAKLFADQLAADRAARRAAACL